MVHPILKSISCLYLTALICFSSSFVRFSKAFLKYPFLLPQLPLGQSRKPRPPNLQPSISPQTNLLYFLSNSLPLQITIQPQYQHIGKLGLMHKVLNDGLHIGQGRVCDLRRDELFGVVLRPVSKAGVLEGVMFEVAADACEDHARLELGGLHWEGVQRVEF